MSTPLRPLLVLSASGLRLHMEDCRFRPGYRVIWRWADDKPAAEVRQAVENFSIHPCARCRPLEALDTWERIMAHEPPRSRPAYMLRSAS